MGPQLIDPAALLGLDAEAVFGALTGHTGVGVFVSNVAGQTVFVNDRWCELTGLTNEEALGDGWQNALHPDDVKHVAPEWEAAAAEGRDSVAEYRFVRPGGSEVWIQGFAAALHDADGQLLGWVGTCVDLTERKLAEEALRRERERFQAAFDNAPIGMALVSPDGRWLQVNPSFCELLGYDSLQLLGLSFEDITHPDDLEASREHSRRQLDDEVVQARIEKRYLRSDGRPLWVAVSSTLVRGAGGEPLHFVAQIEDIGSRRRAERRLQRLADTDPLTGLANRRRFEEELRRELHRLKKEGGESAVLLVDLDRFKEVNDRLGHKTGDDVLRRTASLLRRRLRSTDVVARLGGDEFAAIIPGAGSDRARKVARNLTAALRQNEIRLEGGAIVLATASIGLVPLGPGNPETSEAVLVAADGALYGAKRAGRDRVAAA